MTPEKIIAYCRAHNITLEPTDKGTIIIDIPDKAVWSKELTEAISQHKVELMRLLYIEGAFRGEIVDGCGNSKCLYQCLFMKDIGKCPYHLTEGTYRIKGGEWKRVLH